MTFFSRSDTQWFACILINDTYLSCLLVFVSPFFIGRTTMGSRSCLVAVVFIVYFHLSLLPFKSQILHNSFQGSFCCYNFHFMFSFFFISEQACVQFALLSCHWYSTIFSALFSHAYDIFLSVTSSIWKCGTFCWCFLFSHWENEWSMEMKGRKGEAPKKNVDVDRSYVTNDEWKPTINNNQNNAKVSTYTHIQWVVFYPLEKKEARFFRRLLFTFYLIL